MKIADNCVVAVAYTLREDGPAGPVHEEVDRAHPLQFLFGTEKLLPAFERVLRGKQLGDGFSFTLPPTQAYGHRQEKEVIDVPVEIFNNDAAELKELLHVGYFLTLTDQSGRQRNGKVLAIGGETVTIDFNHAMAGKTLHFDGVVLAVREATAEEIAQGQPLSRT